MKRMRTRVFGISAAAGLVLLASCGGSGGKQPTPEDLPIGLLPEQTPGWSADDREFFLHGSMGTEVVPEAFFAAWLTVFPELFPSPTLENFGAVPGVDGSLPVGFSRRRVAYLGGLPSVGINCASCHAARIEVPGAPPVLVLGNAAPFDAEAFFGSVVVAMVKMTDPEVLKVFLPAYAAARGADPRSVREAVSKEVEAIATVLKEDPFANLGAASGELHRIDPEDLEVVQPFSEDPVPMAPLARNVLRVLHNMRAALHLPDVLPAGAPPASGPGRNDAFGLLSVELLGRPVEYAPVKFGIVWNVDRRRYVHWDGNTPSPMARNFLAAVGLGAPLVNRNAILDVAVLRRQTALSETIRPPKYPWAVDRGAAKRGEATYRAQCASCHDGPEDDGRLYAVSEIGTDPVRARAFDDAQADGFNRFLSTVKAEGFDGQKEPAIRATGRYWAADLAGVWARGPYLHNGSVRTIADLLTPPASRPKAWKRGTRAYDASGVGPADAGAYTFDTGASGNSNAGHDYGTGLSAEAKRDLLEFLKTK
jgi:mono/diheme cytochrome c family protein